jgi:hypothetical protein
MVNDVDERFDERDVWLLPYWLAGRVSRETATVAFRFLGNENELMTDALLGEIVRDHIHVTQREWNALTFDKDLVADELGFASSDKIRSDNEVAAEVRGKWRFERATPANDELEGIILSRAEVEPEIRVLGSGWRVSTSGDRIRMYVTVLNAVDDTHPDELWRVVDGALEDYRNEGDLPTATLPLFESIKAGWDWPVYYRDMIANSRLLWSASGEDIDLAALAAEQPHDNHL